MLRFLLDAHPELACPPETNLPGLCVQLATVWSLIEGAPLLARVYPQARFVCMYRHPMDVIASGVEACPWGLGGYGFDPYIAATPGNVVIAPGISKACFSAERERFGPADYKIWYTSQLMPVSASSASSWGWRAGNDNP